MDCIPITVVMRSYNDAALLPRTLAALDAQEGVSITLIVFESASTDNSLTIIKDHGAAHIHEMKPGSYWSSEVLNAGVAEAQTELVAFLNSDAIIHGNQSLRALAEAILKDDACAGAFAKQITRPDASACTRLDYSIAFDFRHELGRRHQNCLSLVFSMIRKSAWEHLPFDPDLTYAEDYAWSTHMQQQGKFIAYVPEAIAEHSHEYTWKERYKRNFGDSAAIAKVRSQPPNGFLREVVLPLLRRTVRDCYRLHRIGYGRAFWRLPVYRYPLLLGAWRGARAGWKHFHHGPGGRQPRAS